MSLDVQLRGGERVRQALGPALTREPRERLLRGVATFAAREAVLGARGLGGIPTSINAEVSELGARIVSRHPGAFAAEVGRRPGAKQPPIEAVLAWAARQGISGIERVAFPIARAIAQRGIKGRFFMRHARERLLGHELPRLVEQATREIAQRWSR